MPIVTYLWLNNIYSNLREIVSKNIHFDKQWQDAVKFFVFFSWTQIMQQLWMQIFIKYFSQMGQRKLRILMKLIRIGDRVLPLQNTGSDRIRWNIRLGRVGGRLRLGLVAAYDFAKCFSYKTHYLYFHADLLLIIWQANKLSFIHQL